MKKFDTFGADFDPKMFPLFVPKDKDLAEHLGSLTPNQINQMKDRLTGMDAFGLPGDPHHPDTIKTKYVESILLKSNQRFKSIDELLASRELLHVNDKAIKDSTGTID